MMNNKDITVAKSNRVRKGFDIFWYRLFQIITILCASVIIFVIIFILIRGLTPFFQSYDIDGQSYRVNLGEFLIGTTWFTSPNHYGVGYIIINTIYCVILSLLIAVPMAIFSSLFITRIAPKPISKFLSIVVELLASIPSIIYGLFGMGYITAFSKWVADLFNVQTAGGLSTLSVVLVLAFMIYPTITMLSVTSINAVDKNIINGSLALGASKTQTNFKVVLTSAKNGIFAGIILGVGRAMGEATAISMVSGNANSGPTFSLFDITNTLTTAILRGFNDTVGLDYDIRFSVGVVLILLIVGVNIILNAVKKRIGEKSR